MLAPPRPPADPEALIPEARERQRRRRIFTAAAVALIAATVIAVYSIAGVNRPATSEARGGPAGVSPCRSSQLAMTVAMQGGLTGGGFFGGATIQNTSGSPCGLPGAGAHLPIVQILYRGAPVPLRETHHVNRHWLAPILKPGGSTTLEMAWPGFCAVPHDPASRGGYARRPFSVVFRVRLGSGIVLTAPPVRGGPPCPGRGNGTLVELVGAARA